MKKEIRKSNKASVEKAERIESEIKRLQEIIHIGSWYLDVETNQVTWTEGLYKMYGFDATKPVPPYTEHMKLFTPESWEILSKSLENTKITGEPYELELETVKKDASNGWMWVRGEAVADDNGKIVGLWGAAQDITERKQIEERLKKSESRFRLLTENARDIIYRMSIPEGEYEYVSPASLEIMGYTPEQFYNEPLLIEKIIHPDWTEYFKKEWSNLIKGVVPPSYEYQIIHKSGEVRWLNQRNSLIKDEDGNPLALEGVVTDITKHKGIEKELTLAKENIEKNELKYRSLFNSMQEGVYLHNLVYNEHGEACDYRIIDANPISEEYLNIKREDAIGKLATELFETNEAPFLDVYAKVVETGKPVSFEQYFEPMEKYFFISVFSPKKGEFATVFVDITKSKHYEKQLIVAKEKAEESDRLKSAFLANMSHEIRTPMNGILGFADLLRSQKLRKNQQEEFISIIEKSGERLLHTINEIIDISKIESGEMKVLASDVNINDCLDEFYGFFKPEAEEKQIELKLSKVLMHKEAIINTDQDKLNGILTNLIKNAIKYTEKGTIEIGYNMNDTNTEVDFYIKDTGIGIPYNRQVAIFERFVQADIENKMAHQGTGLGLAITRAYVDMLGGTIWVESEEGTGSTFYFSLPYFNEKMAEAGSADLVKAEQNTHKKVKILIVEDDETSSQLLTTMVSSFANEIINVINGKDAIDACKNTPDIDLVLMDIQMPGMNGYEATKIIREFNKDIIIIAQTAFAFSGNKEKSLAAGCNDHILKPIKKDDLELLIHKHLQEKRGFQEAD